jgi:hypothetical protein
MGVFSVPLEIGGPQDERFERVACGNEGAQPLLGAITLEEFGLGIDPVGQKLTPVPGYLMALA